MKALARVALATLIATAAVAVPVSPAAAGPSVEVHPFGSAPALGAPDFALNGGVVDLVAHPTQAGYWVLGRDGGVFTHGAAAFFGSTGGMRLNAPVLAMEPTPTGAGYWFVGQDGGIFNFGNARFFGSTGALSLAAPIVGMAAAPSGNGYWLVALDGGVFGFGDAPYHGSAAGAGVPIIAIEPSRSGRGYVLLGADGSLRSFGDASQFATTTLPQGATDFALTPSGAGAWVLAADGAVHSYGDAPFQGAATNDTMSGRAIARAADGSGYWIALAPVEVTSPAPPNSGVGKRVIYSNSQQRVWLVEANGNVAHSFLVSGRQGVPAPGTYQVFSKSAMSSAHGGDLRLPYMTRFAHGRSLAIGFHGIPLRGNGSPIQTDAELGQFRSAGCVRMHQAEVKILYDFAPVGTAVVVLP